MKLLLVITATQLLKGDETFAGQPVKNQDGSYFALVPYQGTLLKVNEENWLVEYHDGTKEVWTNEQILENTGYTDYLVDGTWADGGEDNEEEDNDNEDEDNAGEDDPEPVIPVETPEPVIANEEPVITADAVTEPVTVNEETPKSE